MTKKIIAVILISIALGIGFVYLTKPSQNRSYDQNPTTSQNPSSTAENTPSKPTPSFPPIDESTNLKQTNTNLTPSDFSKDYQQLKQDIQNF